MHIKNKFLILLIVVTSTSQLFAADFVGLYLDTNVKVVLSDDFRSMYAYQKTMPLIPRFSFATDIAREQTNLASRGEPLVIHLTPEGESFFADMMSDVGQPLSEKYMETDEEFDDTILTQPSLYADISSAMLSYFFRKLTHGKLDLVLLTPPLDEPSDNLISGVELGVRLTQYYGVRVRMLDNGTMPTYGMQLEFFPAQNVSIKLSHEFIANVGGTGTLDDNATISPDVPIVPDVTGATDSTNDAANKTDQRTGVEFNIKF